MESKGGFGFLFFVVSFFYVCGFLISDTGTRM